MPLVDTDTAKEITADREARLAEAMANPKVASALFTLFSEGVDPSIAHGILARLHRIKGELNDALKNRNP